VSDGFSKTAIIIFQLMAVVCMILFSGCKSNSTTSSDGSQSLNDSDGNAYTSITIGTQEWFVENSQVTHYRNGDTIGYVPGNGEWISQTIGSYC